MYMYMRLLIVGVIFTGLSVYAQTVHLRGTISNGTGQPVAGAIVTLMGLDLKDTTGSDGAYSITQTISALSPHATPAGRISLTGSVLEFHLSEPSPVTVEIFDIKSSLLKKEMREPKEAGVYRLNIDKEYPATQLLIIRASIGAELSTFRYSPLNGRHSVNPLVNNSSSHSGMLAKAAAAVDSLEIMAGGYSTQVVEVESYDEMIDVTLETADKWGGLGNSPGPSAGCGQSQGITNGRKNITSGGQQRAYIIDIPNNYDQDTPHRLFFTFHWIGSTAEAVQSQNYYFLKPLAQADNLPAIFVAPQALPGNPSGTWNTQNNTDHVFFDDLFAYVKENLCIDTTRVFTTGFSFGGMMTYSLSENHQNQIRAGVGIAPANYNIYVPPKTNESMAWMQTTGMSDGTCPWINNESQRRGAKFIALDHAEDNNCTIPNDVPTRQNGQYLCYDFEDCDEGYPVKACTFAGGHTNQDGNPNWIPLESWDFFMQF